MLFVPLVFLTPPLPAENWRRNLFAEASFDYTTVLSENMAKSGPNHGLGWSNPTKLVCVLCRWMGTSTSFEPETPEILANCPHKLKRWDTGHHRTRADGVDPNRVVRSLGPRLFRSNCWNQVNADLPLSVLNRRVFKLFINTRPRANLKVIH